MPAALPQPMREAVIEQSLKPGIAQHDLEPRSGRRIARQSRIYLVSQVSESHRRHYVIVRIPVGRHWRVATRGTPRTAYNCPTNTIKYEGEGGESIAEAYQGTYPTYTVGFISDSSCLRSSSTARKGGSRA